MPLKLWFSSECFWPPQLVLLGDSGVGKSCIVLRFVRGQFDPSSKVSSLPRLTLPGTWSYASVSSFSAPGPSFYIIWECPIWERSCCWHCGTGYGRCIIFVANDSSSGFHDGEVWDLGHCGPRKVGFIIPPHPTISRIVSEVTRLYVRAVETLSIQSLCEQRCGFFHQPSHKCVDDNKKTKQENKKQMCWQ